MKSLVLGMLLVFVPVIHAQVEIPKAVTDSLDKDYPGWRLSLVSEEVKTFFKERYPNDSPNIIAGDFDGNGDKDLAIILEHTNFNEPGKSFTHISAFVVYFNRGGKYKKHVIGEGAPADDIVYLNLVKRGESIREFTSDKKYPAKNDSISVSQFEKASSTLVFVKGKFKEVITSD